MAFSSTILSLDLVDSLKNLWMSTGFMTSTTELWQNLIMLVIACVLIYLAVYKEFEPNLLLAIGFGMFIINIPGTYNVLYGTLGYTFFDANNLSQALTLEDGTVISGTVAQLAQMLNIDTTGMSMLDKVAAITAEVEKLFPGITVTSTHEVVADQGIFYYLYKGV